MNNYHFKNFKLVKHFSPLYEGVVFEISFIKTVSSGATEWQTPIILSTEEAKELAQEIIKEL